MTRLDAGVRLLAARPGLSSLAWRLSQLWPGGVRVGETAVVSTQVHLLDPARPGEVTVLVNRDAGRVFYGRRRTGEVVHVDVFHAVADVDCAAVAAAVRRAAEAYRADFPSSTFPGPDFVDLQTGTGGGRATGSLRSGGRESLRRAHKGHVHLAVRCGGRDAAFCFYLVASVEAAVAAQGVELRRVDRVCAREAAQGPYGDDLSPYTALTDSWLREVPSEGGTAAPAGGTTPAGEETLLQAAARLADEFGSVEARELLSSLLRPVSATEVRLPGWTPPRVRDALARLAREGWAEAAGPLWVLTEAGRALEAVFRRRLREVELALRSAARRVAASAARDLSGAGRSRAVAVRGRHRRTARRQAGQPVTELAVAETVVAAARRRPPGPGRPLRVVPDDLHVCHRLRPRRVDLCLLVDASASMEGGRMRAAKMLARHLLLTSRDRVAVMAFQERGAVLAVPFTRNYAAAERGLARLVPAGLTPLAAGLAAAREYLRRSHAKNPLLLLVTDGIPTVSATGSSPLEEALVEAERIGGARVALACIGLEPNERYLAELARRAGGTLHVVSELRAEVLAEVARIERQRRREGLPG